MGKTFTETHLGKIFFVSQPNKEMLFHTYFEFRRDTILTVYGCIQVYGSNPFSVSTPKNSAFKITEDIFKARLESIKNDDSWEEVSAEEYGRRIQKQREYVAQHTKKPKQKVKTVKGRGGRNRKMQVIS